MNFFILEGVYVVSGGLSEGFEVIGVLYVIFGYLWDIFIVYKDNIFY